MAPQRTAVDPGALLDGGPDLESGTVRLLVDGPHDADDLDPDLTVATGTVDFGAVRVPVPLRGTVAVEPSEKGRMQAVHISLPEGRLSVSALAAPKSSRLWPELVKEIDTSLRDGGARVRSFQGCWGRELHATSGAATSVFVGVDGARWMLYGVATGPTRDADPLLEELRRLLRGTIVVRGRSPYPVRTVLPLEAPEHLAAPDPVPVGPPPAAGRSGAPPSAPPTVAFPAIGTRRPGSVRGAGGFPPHRAVPRDGAGPVHRANGSPPVPASGARPVPPPAVDAPRRADPVPRSPGARWTSTGSPASPERQQGPGRRRPEDPPPASTGRRWAPEPAVRRPPAEPPSSPVPAVLRRGRHAAAEPVGPGGIGPGGIGPAGPGRHGAADGGGPEPVTVPLAVLRSPADPPATARPSGRHHRRD